MADYIHWGLLHLGGWGLILLAAAGAGNLFLRRQRFHSAVERLVFTLALGLGLCALIIFILGLLGLLYKAVVWGLTLGGALATALLNRRQGAALADIKLLSRHSRPRILLIGLAAALGLAYWSLLFLLTQYPPHQWDAIAHHFVLARDYLEEHRLVAVTGVNFPVLPCLNHLLFTWGMAMADDVLAQMMEHTFLMLTALGLYAWGRRENRPAFGVAVAALWLGQPLAVWLSATGYVDVCLTAYAFLGVYAMRVFWEGRDARWWYLAMALLGMAAGVKLPGLFYALVASALGFWALMQSRVSWRPFAKSKGKEAADREAQEGARFTWKSFAGGLALAFLTLSPFYAFIAYHTGNPVWPTFAELSRGIYGSREAVDGANWWFHNAGQPRTLENLLTMPVDIVLYPERFEADDNQGLFPLIMFWPLALIVGFWHRSARWYGLWTLAFTLFWFRNPNLIRYWLSAVPLAGLALYESVRWLMEKISKSAAAHRVAWAALTLLAVVWGSRTVFGEIRDLGWPSVHPKDREAFVSMLNGYSGVRHINRQANQEDVVCVINAGFLNYYFKPRVIDIFGLLYTNKKPAFNWPEDEPWVRWLDSQNVGWIYVYHANPHPSLNIRKRNLVLNPYWPDYELAFADNVVWVFRRKPIPAN